MKPSRVLLVLQSTSAGGMETHVVDLAAEYRRRGVDAQVVLPVGPELDGVAARLEALAVPCARVTTDARTGRAAQVAGMRAFAALLRSFRPSVVHLHTGGATGGLAVAALVRALTRSTLVITEHDVPGATPGAPQQLTRGALDRLCHGVVAVSRRNAALRTARLPVRARTFSVVLNGVPAPEVSPSTRDEHRLAVRALHGLGHGLVFGSVVRLAEGKGLPTLLEAFAQCPPKSRLLLVGDGPLREPLERQAADIGVAERVCFAGQQSDPARYLDALDVFVLPVPAGSMSIALLEAMARGLPPIITFCGPEEAVISGQTGLGAAPGDPNDLARAMLDLADDPMLRRRLAAAAQEHVRRHYSVGRVADDLLDVYAAARGGGQTGLEAHLPADQRPGDRPATSAAPSGALRVSGARP
ncbi:MAG: glycosyltransferase [Dehalococcoidia bacterium]